MYLLALLFFAAIGWACRRSMDDSPQWVSQPATSVVPLTVAVEIHVHIHNPAAVTKPKVTMQPQQMKFLN
jgi:hypothetical protein